VSALEKSTDALVIRAAESITRRKFLRRVGTFALSVALSGALIGTEFAREARATGTCSDPCGPSPKCGDPNCSGPNNQCSLGGPANCKRRGYSQGDCDSDNVDNTWSETWCLAQDCDRCTGKFQCHDCCCPDAPTSAGPCTSCAGTETKWKCICREKTGSCTAPSC
jgi:hypothetical protein